MTDISESKIANIKITKDEFDIFYSIFFFIFSKSFDHPEYLIILKIVKYGFSKL